MKGYILTDILIREIINLYDRIKKILLKQRATILHKDMYQCYYVVIKYIVKNYMCINGYIIGTLYNSF